MDLETKLLQLSNGTERLMENKLIAVGAILKAAKVFVRIGDLATAERLAGEAAAVLISIKAPIVANPNNRVCYAQGGSKYGI